MQTTISLRCTEGFIDRLDAWIVEAEAKTPGVKFNRSDALRAAAERGFQALEAEKKKAR